MHFLVKILISAVIIAAVSEIGKRFTLLGALIASIPLTATLAMIWLYYETRDQQKIIDFSWSIFWAVIPSQVFFVALPLLLKAGMKFTPALIFSLLTTFMAYWAYVLVLSRFGLRL